jgi:hypothetical protein
MLTISNLDRLLLNSLGGKDLVNISSNCPEKDIGNKCISPFCNFSQTMWQSISRCLVLPWKTGFAAM